MVKNGSVNFSILHVGGSNKRRKGGAAMKLQNQE